MDERDVLIKESVLEDIGDALQEKLKTKKKFLPEVLGDEIRGIESANLTMNKSIAGIFKMQLNLDMEAQ